MAKASQAEQTLVGDLVRELYEAAAAVRSKGDAAASSVGHSVARWQVLYMLAGQARTVPGIARRLGLTRQSVQRIADVLTADGALAAEGNPDHRRSPLYALTPTGRDALHSINAAAATWHQSVQSAFSPTELAQFSDLLRRITELAQA